jgi:signal transduction histidine kinase
VGHGVSPVQAAWLLFAYLALYVFGHLSNPMGGVAAIWPAHAVSFAALVFFPMRRWLLVIAVTGVAEFLLVPLMHWIEAEPQPAIAQTLGFVAANVSTSVGAAALARLFRLFTGKRRQLVLSPLWIVALSVGVAPGSLIGAAIESQSAGTGVLLADIGLWDLASVLAIVTFAPVTFGMIGGFADERPAAQAWEGWCVVALVLALFTWFALVPQPAAEQLVEPMLFGVPLAWLALRFSRRATSIAVAVVASGVVILAGRRTGHVFTAANVAGWRDVIVATDIFLLIGCGGALLINLMTVKHRALLQELEREHVQLRQYAHALDSAEESARRATAADLHDGIGQVLAGLTMTLAAMRAHAGPPKLGALIEEAIGAAREAQEGLRLMIQDLSPPELEHASLDQTLKWLVDLFGTRFGFSVEYKVDGRAELRRDQLRLVYRCVRELLMNACKHSQRQSAELEMELTPRAVDIRVIDEGVGFDVQAYESTSGRRFGLAQLRERVRTAGGTLDIDTVLGEGCRVWVRLPV